MQRCSLQRRFCMLKIAISCFAFDREVHVTGYGLVADYAWPLIAIILFILFIADEFEAQMQVMRETRLTVI